MLTLVTKQIILQNGGNLSKSLPARIGILKTLVVIQDSGLLMGVDGNATPKILYIVPTSLSQKWSVPS